MLIFISQKGNAENIKRILSKPDVDVNAVNLSKWTPLHLAAFVSYSYIYIIMGVSWYVHMSICPAISALVSRTN